jgi:thymidine kinase
MCAKMPAGKTELIIQKLKLHIKEKPSRQQNKPLIAQLISSKIGEDRTIKIHIITQTNT